MAKNDITRRNLLQVAGTTTLFGFSSTAVAAENTESQSQSNSHGLPYDIIVLNNSGQQSQFSISLYEGTEAGEKRSERAVVAQNNRLDVAGNSQGRLNLMKGTYVIEVAGGDSTARKKWYVPEGGVPKWNALSISLTPSNEIKIQEIEV